MLPFDDRTFLMLQGPHGPFFRQLGEMLRSAGARVLRVGFNRGDEAFWFRAPGFHRFNGDADRWADWVAALMAEHAVTDLVLYGDCRPIHAQAIREARYLGITVHIFEEGYLRPYWVTYERDGSNGHSRLMDTSVAQMRAALAASEIDQPDAPARWGDMRQHVFYGALYHFLVLFGGRAYRNFVPHRGMSVMQEFELYLKRLLAMPLHRIQRAIETRKVRRGGFPYHLVLLQLEHDSSFRNHSGFASQTEFIDLVMAGFAEGAPAHHHLVLKAHPLEDGRAHIARTIREAIARHGLRGRVHFLRGGKLAPLLAQARSAVTVNSTAGQQVLWHGLPLKIFGRAVYDKPEFVAQQPLPEFFAAPRRPDTRAYRDYRHYLLETSQVPGGFYSARGRRALLRQVVDMMLAPEDPYDALPAGNAAPRQQLRLVG
ncbi:capsule biosynthesis protein [Paenirhodobacter sp.]|uniref:capsule biosynthesis protein n=1 Tax=Paenirhodobacter sp. TaxID=1965326 RepID=UPI003B3E80BA